MLQVFDAAFSKGGIIGPDAILPCGIARTELVSLIEATPDGGVIVPEKKIEQAAASEAEGRKDIQAAPEAK